MARSLSKESIYRILDANLNRATEGLRVCEEVVRFILNERKLTARFRNIRHRISRVFSSCVRQELIIGRNSKQDVGRNFLSGELKRADYQDIFFANMQRTKESIRVLEEFYKLVDIQAAVKLKKIRYNAYEIEKKTALRLSALSNTRQRFLRSG